ncbi:shikimate dehydrogenase [Lapillicoccus sp.]|uniref:shikimate dehydrogenase n=1 Tax=Lapillicoccus sp. TaxID=1909287 RepID=UPI00345092EA
MPLPRSLTLPASLPSDSRRRAGVLGHPVSHSLSPGLHRAAYRALGLVDWSYDATDVDALELVAHVAGLDATWVGLSLTMPLKEVAFDVASAVSPLARATGAINTLVRRSDGWHGDNTDVHGLVVALQEAGVEQLTDLLVVGSGATARSAVAAGSRLGATRVTFMVRGAARPETVAQAREAGLEVAQTPLGRWPEVVEVVVGTIPPTATSTWADTLPEGGRALLDVVYGDGATPLVLAAGRAGYAVVPGTEMLLHQGAEQVRLMTRHEPPVDAMRAALAAELDSSVSDSSVSDSSSR